MARIAIADDHSFFRRGLAAALGAMGHEVVASVASGEEAMKAVKTLTPELLLLDVRMQPLNGVEVLQALRQTKTAVPVIVLTAELTNDNLFELMQAKVDGILFKHDPENVVRESIETVLSGERHIPKQVMDKAVSLLLQGGSVNSRFADLSGQEMRIANAVTKGLKNRDIGSSMGIAEGTVKVHLHKIFKKLNISTRTELAMLLAAREN